LAQLRQALQQAQRTPSVRRKSSSSRYTNVACFNLVGVVTFSDRPLETTADVLGSPSNCRGSHSFRFLDPDLLHQIRWWRCGAL